MAEPRHPLLLDLTRLLPGPLSSRILLEMGFRVLRVLPPKGDLLTTIAPEVHAWLNEGKEVEVVDLKRSEGRQRLLTLAADAVILMESNRPGVMERLGVGPITLRESNPRLVYVRIAGSPDPSFRELPGHDLTYLAAAGLLPRLEGAWGVVQLADVLGAFWTALAALEGLKIITQPAWVCHPAADNTFATGAPPSMPLAGMMELSTIPGQVQLTTTQCTWKRIRSSRSK